MARKLSNSMAAIIVCIGMFAAVPASAQSTTGPTWQDEVSQHHQLQYQIMKNMTDQMGQMTELMSRAAPNSEEGKKMGEQMGRMAKMMRFMSGLAARPAHTHAQLQKQMDQMRAQMDEMMGTSRTPPIAR